ncbi:MAG: hypothetical protein ACR2MC_13285 [Actinomycetota bacterium]
MALDALTFARRGRGAAVEQLALQLEPSRLFVDRFFRGLESLGHVEVSRDPRTFAITDWDIVPLTLTELADGRYVLVGQRCNRILSALNKMGVVVQRTEQAAAPDRMVLEEVTSSDALNMASHLTKETGFLAEVGRTPWMSMVSVLPSITSFIQSLPRQPLRSFRVAKRWNVGIAQWEPVGDASIPGGYQLYGEGVYYCLRDATDIDNGTMRRGDARVVKHAGAATRGETLVGYEAKSRMMYAPLGAELPLLYGKVATLASGLLPRDDLDSRTVHYTGVPAPLAGRLMNVLSS